MEAAVPSRCMQRAQVHKAQGPAGAPAQQPTSVAFWVMRTRPSSMGVTDLVAFWQSARQRLATKLGTCVQRPHHFC